MSKTQLGREKSGSYETPTGRKLATKRFLQKRPVQVSLMLVLAAIVVFSWQLLNNTANSTDPTIAGHPLSNPHTHLHTIALGVRPGTLYLGTHFGMFTSTDGGKSWPQLRGALNTLMITAIAASPSHPDSLAVAAIPVSGVGVQSGVYFSHDGGNAWNARSPAGLSLSAYPYTVKAGSAGGGHFYAFYNYAGWYETRDMGLHWYAITADALSNMQTPSLLTDPANADHLWLGGDSGLYETRDDGKHWNHIVTVKGNVATTPVRGFLSPSGSPLQCRWWGVVSNVDELDIRHASEAKHPRVKNRDSSQYPPIHILLYTSAAFQVSIGMIDHSTDNPRK